MKKKPIVFTLIAIVALALACAAVFLYERSKVALIIDDEAAWDLRDASPHKKVIITNDGIVARYVSDGKGNVLLSEPGTELVYAAPDSLSEVIGKLEHIKGDCPESYLVAGRPVQKGVFGADMQCALINDGPVTIVIDSRIKE